jgi:hypothetical protein
MKEIKIKIGGVELKGELYDTPTADLVYNSLPLWSRFNTWGDEIYFQIPVETGLEEGAREEVKVGEIGYWPEGNAFCIFFGKTPISTDEKILAASKVNIIGRLVDDPAKLRELKKAKEIGIEKV